MSERWGSASRIANTHAVMRITAEFFLRGADIFSRQHEDDLMKCLIFIAIWTTNLRYAPVNDDALGLGQELGRPVSVLAVANSLRIPYETARRAVNVLVQENKCMRVGRKGVVALNNPGRRSGDFEVQEQIFGMAQRLVTDLKRVGIEANDI